MSLTLAAYLLGMAVIGGFAGYIVKRNSKVLAIVTGILFLVVISLDFIGAFTIHYEGIVELVSKLSDPTQTVELLTPLIAYLPLVAIFAGGFLIGLRKG